MLADLLYDTSRFLGNSAYKHPTKGFHIMKLAKSFIEKDGVNLYKAINNFETSLTY